MPPQGDPNAETLVGKFPSASDQKKTTARANLIGKTLGGRYVIERELGRGGMGAVYLAHDKPELHSRPVVVKVLLEESMKNEFVVGKFYQEIESLTRLDDPGVIGIFDAGRLDDGSPYLVMQYVEGTTLRAAMKHEGMDLEQAAAIIRQLGRSITAAHDAGILHRDLKPENVMLRSTASGERLVKIIDFGIAKVKNSMSGPSPMTGLAIGTIGYMSPEQLSARPLTPASDIYSLGVIAYEMLTGRNPFNPDSVFQLLEMQRDGVRVKPSDLRPSVPEAAQQLLLKALAFDPDERFQRAQDFGDQLARYLTSGYDPSESPTQELPTRLSPSGEDNQSETFAAQPGQRIGTGALRPTIETAHVLFMDIVSYSNLLIDEQTERLQELQDIVRSTQEFQNAQLAGQLLRLPTGDGMALSFFGDPESPMRCAVEVSQALRQHPDIRLRMGVHSGFVYRLPDINANMNIAGGGINMAQRVMDCGDAGHIILSKRVADDLGQLGRWAKDLHDLGEAEVKHGVRLHIYNLYNDEIGNSEVPARLRPQRQRRLPRRAVVVAVAVLILALISTASFFLVKSALTPTQSLTYSLTVQKISGGQRDGDEFQSTGQESYGNRWQYRMNVTAGQSGYLYMLNEGTVKYNVLFPTEPNNNHLTANQTMQTVRYYFDENPGIERVWIILSAQPLSEIDTISKDTAKNVQKLTITDPAQIKTVRDTIARYTITEPVVDKSKKQLVIKGTGNVLVSLLELKHTQQ